MGVIGLTSFIKNKYNTDCMKPVDLSDYKGKVVAIDCYNFLFKILRTNNDNYMLDFLKFIGVFTSNGVIPLFVMDGKPPVEKRDRIRERCNLTYKASETAKKIEDELTQLKTIIANADDKLADIEGHIQKLECQLDSAEKHSLYINKTHRDNLISLFAYLEVPVCKIDNIECDMVCKYLVNYGIAEACITNDSDIILLGCKNVILDFNYRLDKNNSTPSKSVYTTSGNLVNYDNILSQLGYTEAEFTDFCICLGTDLNCRIANVSTYYVYNLIKEYHTIENLLSECKSFEISGKFKYARTRDYLTIDININLLKSNIFNLKNLVNEDDFDGEWVNVSGNSGKNSPKNTSLSTATPNYASITSSSTSASTSSKNTYMIMIPSFERTNITIKCDKNTHDKYSNTIKLVSSVCAKTTPINYIKYSIYCSGYLV